MLLYVVREIQARENLKFSEFKTSLFSIHFHHHYNIRNERNCRLLLTCKMYICTISTMYSSYRSKFKYSEVTYLQVALRQLRFK